MSESNRKNVDMTKPQPGELSIIEAGGSYHLLETPTTPPKSWPHAFASKQDADMFLEAAVNAASGDGSPIPLNALFLACEELERVRDFLAEMDDQASPLQVAGALCASRPWKLPKPTNTEE